MEYSGLSIISGSLVETDYVIAHETAHQWWQTTVGNNEIEYGFLDEGLAEYSVVLFFENYPEYDMKRESLIKSAEQTYRAYCSVYDKLFKKTDTRMLRSLKDFTSEYEYVNIAYVKSAIMYDNLRNTVGEETFFNSLKRYYEDYKFKNATPYDLTGSFEKTGVDVNGYFNSFFSGEVVI
jgi:aminopeptidase N